MKQTYLLFFTILFFGIKGHAQNTIIDSLSYDNYIFVKIDCYTERYHIVETDLIYKFKEGVKIHSVSKDPNIDLDTCFFLNSDQLKFISNLRNEIKNIKINGIKISAWSEKIDIQFNDKIDTVNMESPFFLIERLGSGSSQEKVKVKVK